MKQTDPGVRIIGVEPEWENDAYQSFQRGQRVTLSTTSTSIADAIRVQTLGELTYPIICRFVDDIVTVSEEEIAAATLMAAMETHLLLESAGALGLAAALTYVKPLPQGKPVIALASGRNTTLENLYHLQATKVHPVTLIGKLVRLEPLAMDHVEELFETAQDPDSWTYLSVLRPVW